MSVGRIAELREWNHQRIDEIRADTAPEPEPVTDESIPGADMLPEDWEHILLPPVDFILGAALPAGHVTLLTATGGSGKSTISLEMAVGLALGRELIPGFAPPAPGMTLVVSLEDDLQIITRRLQWIADVFRLTREDCAAVRDNLRFLPVMEPHFFVGDGYRGYRHGPDMERMKAEIDRLRPRLVIIDPAAALLSGAVNENDNGEVQKTVCALRGMLPGDCALLLACHVSKQDRDTAGAARGASAWHDAARQVFALRPPTAKEQTASGEDVEVMILECKKSNYGRRLDPLFLERSHGGVLIPGQHNPARAAESDREALERALLAVVMTSDVTAAEIGNTRSGEAKQNGARVRGLIEERSGQKLSGPKAAQLVGGMLCDGRLTQIAGHKGRLILRVTQGRCRGVEGCRDRIPLRGVEGVEFSPIGGKNSTDFSSPTQGSTDLPSTPSRDPGFLNNPSPPPLDDPEPTGADFAEEDIESLF